MHGTLQPTMRSRGLPAALDGRFESGMLWAALLPLLLLLRPYEGVVQDARIYIGRGLADLDPLGIGRDLMFAADGQTGFTLLRPVVRALLGIMSPSEVSFALAAGGSVAWLGALVILCRGMAPGRAAWAAAICILALPAGYGGFGTFNYGETVFTPRVFAETAVIGALAALLGRRRVLAAVLLAAALALHPLMALPGVAVAAVVLAVEDRRWLVPIAVAGVAVLAAAALKLPLADRLFEPFDADWLAILKARSVNLFPSLWNGDVFARVAVHAATVILAATVAPPRLRTLLLAVLGIAAGGLALATLLGDWLPLVLVTQLQPWRALWLLSFFGNASVALAAVGLWHRGPGARLTLAVLSLAWLSAAMLPVAAALSCAAVALRIADRRGALSGLSPRVGRIALALALGAATVDTVMAGVVLAAYLRTAWAQHGEILYSAMHVPGVQSWPLALGSIAVAIRAARRDRDATAPRPWSAGIRASASVGLVAACVVAAAVWDSTGSERRIIDADERATAELDRLIGPAKGSLLWVDDYSESWFLTRRAAFFSSTQGCPILFSRALALAWQARGRMLIDKGLARQTNLAPWTARDDTAEDLPVSRASVETVCRAPDHPVAIVMPGRRLDVAPPGWVSGVWSPPTPVLYLSGNDGGLRWTKIETYTVVRCPASAAAEAGK